MATSDYFQRGPASVAAGATASPARGTPSSTQAPQALASAGSRFVLRQVKLPPSVPLPKRYFLAKSLAELVMTYAPHEKAMATIGDARPAAVLTPSESQSRETFLDFVYGLLQVPGQRRCPRQWQSRAANVREWQRWRWAWQWQWRCPLRP